MAETYKENRADPRWCRNSAGRIGEYGVIGAEQADESHYDDRSEDDEDSEEGGFGQSTVGQIKFSKKQLYGRQTELIQLLDLWDTHYGTATDPRDGLEAETKNGGSTTVSPCAAFIMGYSGCGKSTLVEELVKRLTKKQQQQQRQKKNKQEDKANTPPQGGLANQKAGWSYLSAKFSQQQQGKAVPFGAFGSLFDHVDADTRQELQRVLWVAQDAIGREDARILGRIFPGLTSMLGELLLPSGASSVGSHSGTTGHGSSSAGFLLRRIQSPEQTQNPPIGRQIATSSVADDSSVSTNASSQYHRSNMKKINKERLQFVLQYFFRLLGANQERPLVLFLDDLQWADPQSLQFLSKLLLDPKVPFLYFVGAYRSNEVADEDHPLNKLIIDVQQKKKKQQPSIDADDETVPSMVQLQLKELTRDHVGQFIADSLHLEIDEVEPLTKAIFTKTLGNPLFTRQALEQLVRKNVLYYDKMMFVWAWNLTSQEELQDLISDDIVEMVKSKITHVSQELQRLLVVASCVTRSGGSFDLETLLEVALEALPEQISTILPTAIEEEEDNYQHETKKTELINLLDQAEVEGLLYRSSSANAFIEYSFAHDRIEEAARSLLNDICQDDHERDCHLAKIGNALYQRAISPHGEDWMYFSAAQHLNAINIANTTNQNGDLHEQRLILADLNHRTAQLSLELLSFAASVDFSRHGIENMLASSDDKSNDNAAIWEAQYECILSLYIIGAEAAYGVGNVELASTYCEEILKHNPRDIDEFLPAYKVKLDILSSKGMANKEEAYNLSLSVLEKMGFKYPKRKQVLRVAAWTTLKQVRARYIPTEESINTMPDASDPVLIDRFDLLTTAGGFAWQCGNITMYVLICCEAIRWMNKNGLTDGSAAAIASFANLLMHQYGDFSTSAKLAELAIQITNRLRRKFSLSRPLNTSNHFVLSWVRPMRTRLEYHTRAYEAAVVSGNMEGAAISKLFSCFNMAFSSVPLSQLESYCCTSVPELQKFEAVFDSFLMSMIWQVCHNLMGRSDSTTSLVGEAVDEAKPPYSNMPLPIVVALWKRYLCLFFGDWEEGSNNALKAGDQCGDGIPGMMYGHEPVNRGILLWCMLRKTTTSKEAAKYKKPANELLKRLKDLVGKGCVNIAGPTRLIEAERYALVGKKRKAHAAFEEAISICQSGEFHQYAGLANERYALFLKEVGDSEASYKHLEQAIDCYSQWGAQKKVDLLRASQREAAR